MRTRIASLCLVLVISFSISGTLAYLTYTANAAVNRLSVSGDTSIKVVETTKLNNTAYSTDEEFHSATDENEGVNKADGDDGSKLSWVKVERDGANVEAEVIRMTIAPEAEYLDADGETPLGNVFLEQDWTSPQQDATTSKWYLQNTLFRVYLSSDWQSNFIWKDGTFVYKKTIKEGASTAKLVSGVEWNNDGGFDRTKYGEVTVKVVADAIQSSADALTHWGVEVDASGNVSLKS